MSGDLITSGLAGTVSKATSSHDSRWGTRVIGAAMVVALSIAYVLDKNSASGTHSPIVYLLCGVGLMLGVMLALSDVQSGMSLFLLVGCISPRFGANFRLEDLLLPAIILAWIGRSSRGGQFYLRTPVTIAALLVALTMILAFSWGLAQGTIPRPIDGIFIVFKRIEYILLFYLALNSVTSHEECTSLITTFLCGAVAASIIALGTAGADASVGDTRATGLDDDNYNTFAGFLVIAASLSMAGALHYRGRARTALAVVTLILIGTLLKTYSREGYFILAVALLLLGVMRYRILIPVIILVTIGAQIVLPESVLMRVSDSVSEVKNYQHESSGTNSFTARVEGWNMRWHMVENQPLLGNGPGSAPLHVDNEYLLRLIESGIIGLSAFFLLLISFWRYLRICSRKLARTVSEPFVYGLIAAFGAMLVQGTVAAAWSTIRTMEPFWILTGAIGGIIVHSRNRPTDEDQTASIDAVPAVVS